MCAVGGFFISIPVFLTGEPTKPKPSSRTDRISSRDNPVHVHPVPLDAGHRDERLHRAGHHLLRLCHGAQRVHLAAREDERREGVGAAAARAVFTTQLLPQPGFACAAQPIASHELHAQLVRYAPCAEYRQRTVHPEARYDHAPHGGQPELDEDVHVASSGSQWKCQSGHAQRYAGPEQCCHHELAARTVHFGVASPFALKCDALFPLLSNIFYFTI